MKYGFYFHCDIWPVIGWIVGGASEPSNVSFVDKKIFTLNFKIFNNLGNRGWMGTTKLPSNKRTTEKECSTGGKE